MPYTADKPTTAPTPESLRARIPGWGADLDPKNRPSYPQEIPGIETGAHWTFPERQPELSPRERSIEHEQLTPVFGTTRPTRLLSGVMRRFAYRRFSEGRAAHWLLLLASDRVDAAESHALSLFSRHPDNPITQTGIIGELHGHGLRSRFGKNRADLRHQWMDPILVAAPWVVVGVLLFRTVRRALR